MTTYGYFKNCLMGLILFLLIPNLTIAQINWVKDDNNPVLESFATWNEVGIGGPVVIFDEGLFKMWFGGGQETPFLSSIGYAESSDGIDWDYNEEPVILSGGIGSWNQMIFPGCVNKINDTLKMWYCGSSDNWYINGSIGYAWSLDGIEWEIFNTPVLEGGPGTWDEHVVFMPVVHYDESVYHMWYAGWGEGSNWDNGIGYATSTDGINWIKDELNNPVFIPESGFFYSDYIYPNSLIYFNGEYQLWFTGTIDNTSNERIGYVTSTDGIEWTVKNNQLPVMLPGNSGSWDDSFVNNNSVLIHDNQYKTWYQGKHLLDSYSKIGFALGDYITGISEPTSGTISTVYPNPCSGVACFNLEISDQSLTILDLYSKSGQKIKRLLNENKMPGIYKIKTDLSDLPAGIYFYKLKTNEGVQTKKLIKME